MNTETKSFILSLLLFTSFLNNASSQQDMRLKSNPVTLAQYLSDVVKGNLGYIAGQFNVSIAAAELEAAKVFPDPEISIAYANNEDRVLQMGQSFETGISYPINLGKKRQIGISLATSQHELSQLMLNVYFQNLRAEAAFSYFVCLKNQRIVLLQKDIYEQLVRLANADSIRYKTGEANGIDALQSSLEARTQLTEVYQSIADMQNASLDLMRLQGKIASDTLFNPSEDFPYEKRDFILYKLISNAVESRADLLVALKNKEISENELNLLKAYRAFEFSIEGGYSLNSIVKNEIAPAPAYNGLSAGMAFPLKFSSINKGSLNAAQMAIKQSQLLYEETALQLTSEVIKAYNNYVARDKKVEQYKSGLIEDAGKILQGRIYSYQRGESELIDVLNASRTFTELQLSRIEAMFEYTAALIELERSAGIWDLSQ